MENINLEKAKLLIDSEILKRARGFGKIFYPQEVGGHGRVRREGDIFRVKEIFYVKHDEATGAHFTANDDASHEAWREYRDKGGDPTEWRLIWHFHNFAAGDAHYSGEDEGVIKGFSLAAPWAITLLFNGEGEARAWLFLFLQGRKESTSIELPVKIECQPSEELIKELTREVKAKGGKPKSKIFPQVFSWIPYDVRQGRQPKHGHFRQERNERDGRGEIGETEGGNDGKEKQS